MKTVKLIVGVILGILSAGAFIVASNIPRFEWPDIDNTPIIMGFQGVGAVFFIICILLLISYFKGEKS